MAHRFILSLLSLFFSIQLLGDSINIAPNDVSLLEHSEFFIDVGAKRSYDDIQKNTQFVKTDTDFLSLGYLTDQAIWVRFSLTNPTDERLIRNLHIDNSMLDFITLYEDNGNSRTVGALARPPYDGIIDFYFPLTIEPHTTHTFYLKILSNTCATYFHLSAESTEILWSKNYYRSIILIFFLGVMLTLVVYNAFIYAFTRERVYLYYVLFILLISYNHYVSYTGMLFPFFKLFGVSDAFVTWYTALDAYLGIYYFVGIEVFFILFFTALTQTRRFPIIHRLFIGMMALTVLTVAISILSGQYLLYVLVYSAVLIFSVAFAFSIYLTYKRDENALYYLLGLGISEAGTVLFLLYNFGVYIPDGGYWYFYEMSMAAEGILFSIVLSKKLRRTDALTRALDTQKVLIRELHHRVKNNLQFIVSLYRLKLRSILDASGRAKLEEAESNIRSIGRIHEILYERNDISSLDAHDYLSDMIHEIRRGYPAQNVTITLNTNIRLGVDQAIYCALIVNELVTNALKYAFDETNGTIHIDLEQVDSVYRLSVSDNGNGFEWDQKHESFGLRLLERLVKDELKGSYEYLNNKGSTYTIRWR